MRFLLQGDVFIYYGLINFHQNLRLYMDSRDDTQMVGRKKNLQVRHTHTHTRTHAHTHTHAHAHARTHAHTHIDIFVHPNTHIYSSKLA